MNRTNRSYWIALTAGAVVLLGAALAICYYRGNPATWQLEDKQAKLWDVVLRAGAGCVAIIGAAITVFKYFEDKARQRKQDLNAELRQMEQDRREKIKDFLQERQTVYRRLGLSLATIMYYDPHDSRDVEEWNSAKKKFYEIYWGEIPLVADDAVMDLLKPFSAKLHKAESKEDKEALAEQVPTITEACRKSLEDEWKNIKEAEEQSSHVV